MASCLQMSLLRINNGEPIPVAYIKAEVEQEASVVSFLLNPTLCTCRRDTNMSCVCSSSLQTSSRWNVIPTMEATSKAEDPAYILMRFSMNSSTLRRDPDWMCPIFHPEAINVSDSLISNTTHKAVLFKQWLNRIEHGCNAGQCVLCEVFRGRGFTADQIVPIAQGSATEAQADHRWTDRHLDNHERHASSHQADSRSVIEAARVVKFQGSCRLFSEGRIGY